jgi:hypothetical protein
MSETKIVKLAMNKVVVKKTNKPNAKCIQCSKKIYSYAASLGFEGVTCKECKESN